MAALSAAPTVGWVAKGRQWRVPKDGKEFVGCLVGGYRATREELKDEMWKRYGIRIVTHFGLERQKDMGIFIDSRTEICIILTDDIKSMLTRVLGACKTGGIEHVGITRKPHTWDPAFFAAGFSNPPRWRDGIDVDKFDAKRLEEERLAELKDLEERPTRTAWIDPALRQGAPLVTAKVEALATIKKYQPAAAEKKAEPKKVEPKKKGEGKTRDKTFGPALIAARTKIGLSQAQVAKRLDLAQTMMSSYERGVSIPLYGYWMRLRELLPDLPAPAGMKGQKLYEERGGLKRRGADTVEKAAPKKEAAKKEAAPPKAAPAPAPIRPLVKPELTPEPTATADDRMTIALRSGGSISLTITAPLFKLRGEDRAFVFDLIDRLQGYEEGKK